MAKRSLYTIMITFLLLSILTLTVDIRSAQAEPRTWTVDDDDLGADFQAIQEAINAASDGELIYVYSGIYYEHLIVDKSLTLVGEEKLSTIIDGNETGTVIKVVAKNVAISRFTIQNSLRTPGTSYAGIKISGHACNLTDNHVTRNKIGILVTSQKSRIVENIVTKNGQGIALYDSSEVTVEANNVSANTVGISLAFSSNNMIVDNRVANSSAGGHGIHLSSNSFNNTIESNDLVNNFHGMWLVNSFNNWVVNNTIANNELLGIELASSSSNTFHHNNIVNNPTPVRIDTGTPNESICIWDDGYPSGGNYWHGYTDVDQYSGPNQNQLGSDEIWDKPYILNENNKDRYPSVRPYGDISDIIPDEGKPTADAGPNQTVNVGTPVYFDARGSTGNIVSYEWDFGDGTRGIGVTCSHTYSEPGNYTANLTVKDAAGNFDTDQLTATVVSVEVYPPWIYSLAVLVGVAIVALLFWKHKVSRKKRRKRMGKLRASIADSENF